MPLPPNTDGNRKPFIIPDSAERPYHGIGFFKKYHDSGQVPEVSHMALEHQMAAYMRGNNRGIGRYFYEQPLLQAAPRDDAEENEGNKRPSKRQRKSQNQ